MLTFLSLSDGALAEESKALLEESDENNEYPILNLTVYCSFCRTGEVVCLRQNSISTLSRASGSEVDQKEVVRVKPGMNSWIPDSS